MADNFWDYGPSYDYSTVDTSTGDWGGYDQIYNADNTGGSYSDASNLWDYSTPSTTTTTPSTTSQDTSGYYQGLSNILYPTLNLSNAQQMPQAGLGYAPTDAGVGVGVSPAANSLTAEQSIPTPNTGYKPEGEGFLSKLFSNAGSKAATPYERDPIGSILKTAAGIYGMNQANQNRRALQQVAQPMQQYQQKLSETYTNPQAYLNSPEARAFQSQLAQQLIRRDAKEGRRSQYGARANELNQKMLAELGNYRQGLAKLYQPQVQAPIVAAMQQNQPTAQLIKSLYDLYK